MSELTFSPGLAWSEYRRIWWAYGMAVVVAFLMSSYFSVGYLAGSLDISTWDNSAWLNGLAGLGITSVMTAYQAFLYARGDVSGGKKATLLAICVAVGFSFLSEIGQGMERDHVRMEQKSQQSPTYQALLGQLDQSGAVAVHPYSSRLADAEMKLARCREQVASGRWRDCIESEARLASVQKQIRDYQQQRQQQQAQLAQQTKAMEKDESNYHPLVNLLRSLLGVNGNIASFLVSFVLIAFFEYAFHYLGSRLAEARFKLLKNGYDVTRKPRKTPLTLIPQNTVNSTSSDLTSRVNSNPTSKVDPQLEQAYQAWSRAVTSQALSPTITPGKDWLKKAGLGSGNDDRQSLVLDWLDRLAQEGGIIPNPNAGTGKAKYIWK